MTAPALVQKLWNYCNILRDDGLSYGDYVEQLTFLLFLKMADEQSRAPIPPSPGLRRTGNKSPIPAGYAQSVHQKIILIDGTRLAELMIEFDIGVSTTRTLALKRVDTDYFTEG